MAEPRKAAAKKAAAPKTKGAAEKTEGRPAPPGGLARLMQSAKNQAATADYAAANTGSNVYSLPVQAAHSEPAAAEQETATVLTLPAGAQAAAQDEPETAEVEPETAEVVVAAQQLEDEAGQQDDVEEKQAAAAQKQAEGEAGQQDVVEEKSVLSQASERRAPVRRAPRRGGKLGAADARQAVTDSFLSARRQPKLWGAAGVRLPVGLRDRIEERLEVDQAESKNYQLALAHYVNAALRLIPDDDLDTCVAWASDYLDSLGMQSPPTVGTGTRLEIEVAQRMRSLPARMRRHTRHGLAGLLHAAAVKRLLDALDLEHKPVEGADDGNSATPVSA